MNNTVINNHSKYFIYLLIGVTFFTLGACTKDAAPLADKPRIESLEIGHENNGMARPGGNLHLDAAIVAPGGVAHISLEIHPEIDGGWTFEQLFTEGYKGLRNTDFHEHIEIPADAQEGEYHLHLAVIDMAGNTVEAEAVLEITAVAEAGTTH